MKGILGMKNEPKTSKCNYLHSLSDDGKVEGQQAATISFDLSGSGPCSDHANEQ